MLENIYYLHLGTEKCKNRAKETVHWPMMNKEIEDTVQNCASFIEYQKENRHEPLIPHDIPNAPWQTLGLDLFHFKDSERLLVVDYLSKCVEVAKLNKFSRLHDYSEIEICICALQYSRENCFEQWYTFYESDL